MITRCWATDSYRRLAAKILLLATRDLETGNIHAESARLFLAGGWAGELAMLLDVDSLLARWLVEQRDGRHL